VVTKGDVDDLLWPAEPVWAESVEEKIAAEAARQVKALWEVKAGGSPKLQRRCYLVDPKPFDGDPAGWYIALVKQTLSPRDPYGRTEQGPHRCRDATETVDTLYPYYPPSGRRLVPVVAAPRNGSTRW